nr:hypothetical protein JCDNAKDM_00120 [Escherichia coli]
MDEPGFTNAKPTLRATLVSLSFTLLFSRYLPSVEILFALEKYTFSGVPVVPAAGEQPEKVSAIDFLFLLIRPTVLPASFTAVNGTGCIANSAGKVNDTTRRIVCGHCAGRGNSGGQQ